MTSANRMRDRLLGYQDPRESSSSRFGLPSNPGFSNPTALAIQLTEWPGLLARQGINRCVRRWSLRRLCCIYSASTRKFAILLRPLGRHLEESNEMPVGTSFLAKRE